MSFKGPGEALCPKNYFLHKTSTPIMQPVGKPVSAKDAFTTCDHMKGGFAVPACQGVKLEDGLGVVQNGLPLSKKFINDAYGAHHYCIHESMVNKTKGKTEFDPNGQPLNGDFTSCSIQ